MKNLQGPEQNDHMVAAAAILLVACIALMAAARPAEDRNYHPIAIEQFCQENPADWKDVHTHVQVTGFVNYLKREGDGDLHIRICAVAGLKHMDRARCIVAECIPELPCARPRKGDEITVRGISRFDAERPGHHWWEVHPVEHLEIGSGK